jgi:flavin-dependent dehydrogenase
MFVVGDAAGYVEPFTGEGIAWAMNSALALAPIVERAIAGWRPDLLVEWGKTHQRLLGVRQRWCRLVALALRSRVMTELLIRTLALAPGLARPFVRRLNRA